MTKHELVGTNSRETHLLISVSVSPCGLGDVCWVTGTEARTTLSMLNYNLTVNHRHMEIL